ncbi:MAG: YraN family protein, partial [Enterobacteriaceae bacterium]
MVNLPARPAATGTINRRQIGQRYEQRARRYLQQQGLLFVAANIHLRGGELDLIMRDGRQWVFVEVRYRQNALFGSAADTVTHSKRHKLRSLANQWLLRCNCNPYHTDYRFDVVAITGSQLQWVI